MRESIDEVKKENEDLRDQRWIYESQLMTLKNVNDSQQKIISFLNKSNNKKELMSSPTFFPKYQAEMEINNFAQDYSASSVDENVMDYSQEESQIQKNYISSSTNWIQESEDGEYQNKSLKISKQDFYEDNKSQNEQDSIDRSRRSYQDIISSFKSIHDKIERWNQK